MSKPLAQALSRNDTPWSSVDIAREPALLGGSCHLLSSLHKEPLF